MSIQLKNIHIENFKSYKNLTDIPISDLSILLGANSSGKSTALQALLALKQTIECNSPDIELLLSGKYVTLGEFNDVISDEGKTFFRIGITVEGKDKREDYGTDDKLTVFWHFSHEEENVCLKEILINVGGSNIKLERSERHIFDIYVENERTVFSVQIDNLKIVQFFVNYNYEFNEQFYNLLKDLDNCFLSNKTAIFFNKNNIIALDQVDNFYFNLLRTRQLDREVTNENKSEEASDLAKQIRQLIDNYCKFQEVQSSIFRDVLNADSKENILEEHIEKLNSKEELIEILEKYEKLYNDFKSLGDKKLILDTRSGQSVSDLTRIENVNKDEQHKYELIYESYNEYCDIINQIFKKIFYLGPLREAPKGLYNIGFESIPKYVGTTGAYFASVLLRENKEREYILPDNEKDTMVLSEVLDEWVSYLDVASDIEVEQNNSFGFSVSIHNKQQIKSDIMNVGIGTSQILPVLIMGLLSEEGEYLIYEQPELHLHPYSQSRLADFFVALAENKRRIVVETHSEYFVLRLRYQVLKNNIDQNDIVVNFFQNKNGTQVEQGILSEYGNLQYPEDFKDETEQLLDDLMRAAIDKKDK